MKKIKYESLNNDEYNCLIDRDDFEEFKDNSERIDIFINSSNVSKPAIIFNIDGQIILEFIPYDRYAELFFLKNAKLKGHFIKSKHIEFILKNIDKVW